MDFGISLDPLAVPQRHALYDSESEEESEQEHQSETEVFTVGGRGADGNFLAGSTLLLALGSTPSVFLKSFTRLREEPFLSLQADVSRVKRGTHSLKGSSVKDVTHFYYTEGKNAKCVVCTHDTELRVEHCNHWTEKVFDHGQPSHVVVYVCQSIHEHFHPSASYEDRTHVMRSLQSSSWPHPPPSVPLEPPNSLQGEAAAILTLCELRGIPCVVHLLYAHSSQTERENVLEFLPSLNQLLKAEVKKEWERPVEEKARTDLANMFT